MKRVALSLSMMLVFAVVTADAVFANNRRMTIEDSLAFKGVGAPQISPDGKWVAYTVSEWDKENNKRTSHIYLAATEGGRAIRLTNGEKGEANPQWSPDGSRLAFTADRDKGNQIWLINVTGGEAERLTAEENGIAGFQWSPDGKRIAFITRDTPKDKAEREKKKKDKFDTVVVEEGALIYSHIWTIHTESKEKKRVTEGEFSASNPRWSPDGKWLAYVKSSDGAQEGSYFELSPDRNSDIYVVAAEGGAPRQLTTNPGSDSNPQWSPDGKWLAYVANSDAKSWAAKSDVQVIAAEGGTPRNLTADFFESAGGGLLWSADGRTIYFTTGVGVYTHLFSVAVGGGQVAQVTQGNRSYAGFDLARDGSKFACLINDSNAPAEIFVGTLGNAASARQVTMINPQIKDFAIAQTEVIKWKGPDNFDIEGVLVKPLGYEAGRRYPLILQIHGGPYGRFDASFNSRAQIFAANGYAVLMPNPRGSTGYGNKFTNANVGDWGGKDYQDIMLGVDAVIARGIADADKCVVMGGSYGGFMTFWTITQTDRFKAAVGHAGISDWYSFHGQSDIPGLMEYGFVGYPWSTETYRKWSPMTHVARVKTPLLITHGEQDRRVPIAQAEEYYRALKRRGVKVVFLRYPREGHGITEPNHQIDWISRQLDWFDSHLGIKRDKAMEPKPTPTAAKGASNATSK